LFFWFIILEPEIYIPEKEFSNEDGKLIGDWVKSAPVTYKTTHPPSNLCAVTYSHVQVDELFHHKNISKLSHC